MRTRTINPDAVFQPIRAAATITGLSVGYIRAGCRSGEIPHIMAGSDFRINMPLWLKRLDELSERR